MTKKPKCGAKAKSTGKPCRNPAGYKTDHLWQGRCFLHGGRSLVKTGRWSKIKRKAVSEKLEELVEIDTDVMDLIPDVQLMRALIQDYIERYEKFRDALLAWHESFHQGENEPKPRQILDLADAVRLLETVSRSIERIHKIQTTGAITIETFKRLMEQMALAVSKHVNDQNVIRAIEREWDSIRVDTRS